MCVCVCTIYTYYIYYVYINKLCVKLCYVYVVCYIIYKVTFILRIIYYIHISELKINGNILGFIFKLSIYLLKLIKYWNITNMLKILKFKSDFLCSKFIIWMFSWCTYVNYASKFNNPYSNFHLSKYWKKN